MLWGRGVEIGHERPDDEKVPLHTMSQGRRRALVPIMQLGMAAYSISLPASVVAWTEPDPEPDE
jgi:hypothetical protein